MTFSQAAIEEFIRDPVLAAYVFFEVELDVFQAARLRFMWYFPELIDSSGVSTGKTELIWIWANLRAILLPQPMPFMRRTIGVYYPVSGISETEFKPKFEKYVEKSKVYREELARTHGRKWGYETVAGGFQHRFRNGGVIVCPPANLAGDAWTSASMRYHDLVAEEYTKMDERSNALDEQLLSRVTAPGFNQHHPVWANHTILLGHAEGTGHKSYKRPAAFKRLITDGSQNHGLFTSCFRDYTEIGVRMGLRPDGKIRTAKLSLTRAQFANIWEGVSMDETEDFYSKAKIDKLRSVHILPETRRPVSDETAIYAYGADTAWSHTRTADASTGVVAKAQPLPASTRSSFGVWRHPDTGAAWRITVPWAFRVFKKDFAQLAAIHHRMHQRFGFSRMVLDPGGGGHEVMRQMARNEQHFDGRANRVIGLSHFDIYHDFPESSPIVVPWVRRSVELSPLFQQNHLLDDAGPVEAINVLMSTLMDNGSILFPEAGDKWPKKQFSAFDPEQQSVIAAIDVMLREFTNVKVLLGKDGHPKISSRSGCRIFHAIRREKKDLAYASLYSLAALFSYLLDPEFAEETSGTSGGGCMAGGGY